MRQQNSDNKFNENHVQKNKNFTNFVIEEGEQISVNMYDYFTGSLLSYSYDIYFPQNNTKVYDVELQKMIQFTKPFQVLASIQLKEDTFQFHNEPFPRSTIFLRKYLYKQASMYMIDRDFNFMKFDVSEFSMGNVHQRLKIPLNTSVLNQRCSDLTYCNVTKTIYAFCASISDKILPNQTIQYYTIMAFENTIVTEINSVVRYCSYLEFEEHPNLDYPLRYLGQAYNIYGRSINTSLYLTYQAVYNGQDTLNRLCISRLDLTYLNSMKKNNSTYSFLEVGQYPFRTKHVLTFDAEFSEENIVDFEILSLSSLNIAIVFKNQGVLICQLSILIFIEGDEAVLSCSLKNTNWVQFIPYHNLISVYLNKEDDDTKFYCAISSPPGVMEIDMTDFKNLRIRKVYYANDDDPMIIGKPYLTSNNNYIVQAIENVITGQQSLRVYCTQSNYFNSVKLDMVLPRGKSKSNFFIFPNFYLNILLYRDEKFVNSTAIFDVKLVFDGTNSKSVVKYNQQEYQLYLYIQNPSGKMIFDRVNFTFFDNYNTQIISVNNANDFKQSIFYNCGDNNFQYTVASYFNGPNYKLQIVNNKTFNDEENDCADSNCYFQFVNKNFLPSLDQHHDFSHCDYNFLLPYDPPQKTIVEEKVANFLMLICLDYSNSTISSYMLPFRNGFNYSIHKTSSVQIPNVQFIKYGFDINLRKIFIITKVHRDQKDWIKQNYEFHFFSVTDEVIWDNFQTPADDFDTLKYIQYLNFDPKSKKGILVTIPDQNLQIFQEFEISWEKFQATMTTQLIWDADEKNMTKRIQTGEDGFFFGLTENNRILVHERVWVEDLDFGYYTLQLMWTKDFPKDLQIHSFDIFDSKYFLIYINDNIIELWNIELKIYLVYRMRLNLYDYSDFGFNLASNSNRLWRSYYDSLLGFTLFYNQSDSVVAYVFVHNLEATQHDSFLISKDVSDIFLNSTSKYTYLTGAGLHNEITLLSANEVRVFQVIFMNHIALNPDNNVRKSLLQSCSQAKLHTNEYGLIIDKAIQISTLKIKPYTQFPGRFNPSINQETQQITLNIYTQNQGLAITPAFKPEDYYVINDADYKVGVYTFKMTYSDDIQSDSKLLLESLVEGQDIFFFANCFYYDQSGKVQDCTNPGIEDGSLSTPFSYYLEFVTQNRKVLRCFNLGRIFLMLDSQHYLTLSQLPNGELDLNQTQGRSLDKFEQHLEVDYLGCSVEGFSSYYMFHRESPEISDRPYTLYFMIYQCFDITPNLLKVALIKFFDKKDDRYDQYLIQKFNDGIKVPNKIIDAAYVNLTFDRTDFGFFRAKIILTCEIEESFSNLLKVYSIEVDLTNKKIYYEEELEFQSVEVDKETFKVTQLQVIPGSDLVLVVDQDYGFFILDMEDYQIIKWFDVNQDNQFKQQDYLQYGPFKVLQIVGDWPTSIHILTNYGIFVFTFDQDLSRRDLLIGSPLNKLVPKEQRIIRNRFSQIGTEIASNQYGYAFLIYDDAKFGQFDVYVGVVSFYSSTNSRFFKKIWIGSNYHCISINHEPYLASNKQDQLAVSFVCDSQIYILRICMRPHITLKLEQFKTLATKQFHNAFIQSPSSSPHVHSNETDKFETQVLGYNQFNISIRAQNDYSLEEDINQLRVNLLLEYKSAYSRSNDYILIVSVIGFGLLLILAHYLVIRSDKKAAKKNLRESQARQIKASYNEINLQNNTFYSSQLNRTSGKLANHGLDLIIDILLLRIFIGNYESVMTPSTSQNQGLQMALGSNESSNYDSFLMAVEKRESSDSVINKAQSDGKTGDSNNQDQQNISKDKIINQPHIKGRLLQDGLETDFNQRKARKTDYSPSSRREQKSSTFKMVRY